MRVFISWSGNRSQALAQALHSWLPMVLHYVDPWLSHSDIEAGERWANVVAKELEASKFGIICVTRENIASPWILFEAGALAKFMQEGRVIPLLLDIEFKDVAGPLAQFQAKKIEKDGMRDVVNSINQFSETKVPDARLAPQFETLWPAFEQKITAVPKTQLPTKQNRPQHEILEELVSSIRGLDLRFRENVVEGIPRRRRRHRFHPMMMMDIMHELEMGPRDPIAILIFVSMFREELPWLYELGVEAYKASQGRGPRAKDSRQRFAKAMHLLRRGPFLQEFGDKETYMLVRESERFLRRFLIEEESEPHDAESEAEIDGDEEDHRAVP